MVTKYTEAELLEMTPQEFRSVVRSSEWAGPTTHVCRGYASTDMVILPKEYAYDFLVFCYRNPLTCPVLDITEPGSPHPPKLAPDADLRTDLPKYIVYQDGQVIHEPTDIKKYWRDDLVAFLLGEAASFNWALLDANLRFRGIGSFSTNIPCIPTGPFQGNLAVYCKVFADSHEAVRAIQITSRHRFQHGAPVHIGDPAILGIKDLSKPDKIPGQSPKPPEKGEVALFWPCFATVRAILLNAKLPLTIVDYPANNFITDKLSEELAVL